MSFFLQALQTAALGLFGFKRLVAYEDLSGSFDVVPGERFELPKVYTS